jgi:hypothetical protein
MNLAPVIPYFGLRSKLDSPTCLNVVPFSQNIFLTFYN